MNRSLIFLTFSILFLIFSVSCSYLQTVGENGRSSGGINSLVATELSGQYESEVDSPIAQLTPSPTDSVHLDENKLDPTKTIKEPQPSITPSSTSTIAVANDVLLEAFPLVVGEIRWYVNVWEYKDHVDEEGNLIWEKSTFYTAETILEHIDGGNSQVYIGQDYLCTKLKQDFSECESFVHEYKYEIKENAVWMYGHIFIQWPLEVGRTWEDESSIWDIQEQIDTSTELGDFEGCYRIQGRYSASWIFYDFCPGIGIVYEQTGMSSEFSSKELVLIASSQE